jgi:hypothetical protein
MSTIATFSMRPETLALLRKRADAVGAPTSRVVDALIAGALNTLSDADLADAVDQLKAGHKRARHDRFERAVLDALDRMVEQFAEHEDEHERGRTMFTLKELRHASGLYPTEALRGLRSLQDRGELVCVEQQEIRVLRQNGDSAPHVEHWFKNPRPPVT